MKAIFVGGKYDGKMFDIADLEKLAEFTGKYSQSYELEEAHDIPCPRPELWNRPKISGYVGPMWDGDKLRYETQEVYNALSY